MDDEDMMDKGGNYDPKETAACMQAMFKKKDLQVRTQKSEPDYSKS
jgi:hypothetical protein